MRNSIVTRILGIILAAVLIGALIGWWASRTVPPAKPQIAENPAPQVVAQSEPVRPIIPAAPKSNSVKVAETIPEAPAAEDPDAWEDKLDAILVSEGESNKKGEELLKLMPGLSEEAQTELAGHIVNLLDDEHFPQAAQYLTNADVPEAVSSVFMDDLYNRGNALKLPLVLAVASNEKHPLHDEAKDLLELYIEQDHGTNWAEWKTAMNTWLEEHKDD